MALTVGDILQVLEDFAPSELAEKWDNVGLQLGKREWPVKTLWVALDPLPEVISAACKQSVDLLVTHHPLIFQPLKSLDFNTPLGRLLETATRHKLAILSAHTNLDTTTDGLNDLLAGRIGLKNLRVLGDSRDPETCRLLLYVPESVRPSVEALLARRASTSTGVDVRSIFHSTATVMTAQPEKESPSKMKDRMGGEPEFIRFETRIGKKEAAGLIREIKKICPEDAFFYDLYPKLSFDVRLGLGRIGDLDRGTDLTQFAGSVKRKLGLQSIRVVGDPQMAVYRVAVCTGSGSSLLGAFLSTDAQVYVTGDLRYHDAREAEAMNRGLIDIGHFASEQIVKEMLAGRIRERLLQFGADVHVETCRLEKDPFMII